MSKVFKIQIIIKRKVYKIHRSTLFKNLTKYWLKYLTLSTNRNNTCIIIQITYEIALLQGTMNVLKYKYDVILRHVQLKGVK